MTVGCGCGCCAGDAVTTPLPSANRPGLPAVAYRSGTHATFFATMLARLSAQPELARFTARAVGDPAIALLDAWAVVADVLTFYTERIANEGRLGTATEPESLRLLGRLAGYQPRAALGASGHLAYTCGPGAETVIPAGTSAGSVPPQGAAPQTFETAADLVARGDWNTLAVRTTRPPQLDPTTVGTLPGITLAGISVLPRAGDRMLVLFDESTPPVPLVVAGSRPDAAAGYTQVDLVAATPDLAANLNSALRAATDGAPRPSGAAILAAIVTYDNRTTLDAGALTTLVRMLREGIALTRPVATEQAAAWLETQVATALALAQTTLAGVLAADRLPSPETDYLLKLAATIDGGADSDSSVPSVTAPLVAAAAILPALRLPPSRPPANPPIDPDRLGPASDAPAALLASLDPRLATLLPLAMARQAVTAPAAAAGLLVMRTKTRPIIPAPPPPVILLEAGGQAPDAEVATTTTLTLEGAQDTVTPGSWLIIEQVGNDPLVCRVGTVTQSTMKISTDPAPTVVVPFTTVQLTSTITTRTPPSDSDLDATRQTVTVWGGGQLAPLAEVAIDDDVANDRIALARGYDGLKPGRLLAVSGERSDIPDTPGITAAELVMLAGIELGVDPQAGSDTTHPTLVLAAPLAYSYRRSTVTISGNVVAATQGQTRSEPLGSGDAGQAGQSFPLRQVTANAPLTALPADTPDGAQDTLVVRVDGVEWREVDTLATAGPRDRVYTTTTASDGTVRVSFGDGTAGSRLSTGSENVTAVYRTGAGVSGDVDAGTVTQLTSRILGVSAVTNPLPMTGGTRADGPADVRTGIPRRSLALDRVVSVPDVEDFTLARAGIGKAAATRLSDGTREFVHLTVAAVDDAPLDAGDDLMVALRRSLADSGDPNLEVEVAARELVPLVVSAGVAVLPDYSFDLVEPAVQAALVAALGFDARALAEPAYPSEAIAAMAAVPGVDYVDLDLFAGLPADLGPVAAAQLTGQVSGVGPVDAQPARRVRTLHDVVTDPATGQTESLTAIALLAGTTVEELARLNPELSTSTLEIGQQIVVSDSVRPAQLAVLPSTIPAALTLRRIP